ncbi:cytochrome P450 3A31 [Folsomia candida]|uniref:cytochrome P450 3A31 n=1 Tax=Folsomia candida TaxID=158441 RepID=UPI000B8F3A2C|nr:cytochrome P450 3A31 [Folsomia candida]
MELLGFQVSTFPVLLTLFLAGLTYFIWSRKRILNQWSGMGIPGPKPDFWMGNAKQLTYGRVDTLGVLTEWRQQYGRVVGYYIGLRPQMQITDADIVKEIFLKQFSNFVNRPDAQGETEHNLARLRDNEWKENRRVLNPSFTTKKLKSLAVMMNKVEDVLMEILDEKCSKNEALPAYKTAQGLTFQIITKTAFAMDVDCQRNENDPLYQNIKAWLNYPFSPLIFLILMFPGLKHLFRFLLRFESRNKLFKDMHRHIKGIINFRRANPEAMKGEADLIGLMIEASAGKHAIDQTKELTTNILKDDDDQTDNIIKTNVKTEEVSKVAKPGKYLLSDEEIMDNCILFLMAGFDSTSNTIAFAFHLLAREPEIQERAYNEIVSEIGDLQVITAEDCKKLPYVEQIIYETLRMYPPVPIFLHRECKETVTIKGITIPAGTVVETPPWILHRDPEYWPEPDKFDPDRFAPENQTETQKFAFAPWGLGPRMCIGARFALIEATTALAKIIREYKIIPSDKYKADMKVQVKYILLNPAEEIYVTLVRR